MSTAQHSIYTNTGIMSEPPGFVPKPMPDGRSLLFDLPRGMRDEIYDQALQDAINLLILSPNEARVITNSGLVGVSFFGDRRP